MSDILVMMQDLGVSSYQGEHSRSILYFYDKVVLCARLKRRGHLVRVVYSTLYFGRFQPNGDTRHRLIACRT